MPQPSRTQKILLVVVALPRRRRHRRRVLPTRPRHPQHHPVAHRRPDDNTLRVLAIPSTGIAVDWILHLWAAAGPRPSR